MFFFVCVFSPSKPNMTNMMEEQSLRSEIGMRNNENYFPISNPHHDMQWILEFIVCFLKQSTIKKRSFLSEV